MIGIWYDSDQENSQHSETGSTVLDCLYVTVIVCDWRRSGWCYKLQISDLVMMYPAGAGDYDWERITLFLHNVLDTLPSPCMGVCQLLKCDSKMFTLERATKTWPILAIKLADQYRFPDTARDRPKTYADTCKWPRAKSQPPEMDQFPNIEHCSRCSLMLSDGSWRLMLIHGQWWLMMVHD